MTDRERMEREIERLKTVVASIKAELPEVLPEAFNTLRRNEWNLAYLEGKRVGRYIADAPRGER